METLTNDMLLNLLNHKDSADIIYYEFYSLHSDLIKGMLMQTCFHEGVVKTHTYAKTDWNNMIYKADCPAYYIIAKNKEYNVNENNQLIEMNTIVFRLDNIRSNINFNREPNNAILTIFLEWLNNSEFVKDVWYVFENYFIMEKNAKELNLL